MHSKSECYCGDISGLQHIIYIMVLDKYKRTYNSTAMIFWELKHQTCQLGSVKLI